MGSTLKAKQGFAEIQGRNCVVCLYMTFFFVFVYLSSIHMLTEIPPGMGLQVEVAARHSKVGGGANSDLLRHRES